MIQILHKNHEKTMLFVGLTGLSRSMKYQYEVRDITPYATAIVYFLCILPSLHTNEKNIIQ